MTHSAILAVAGLLLSQMNTWQTPGPKSGHIWTWQLTLSREAETSWLKPSKFSMPRSLNSHIGLPTKLCRHERCAKVRHPRTIWFFDRSNHRRLQPTDGMSGEGTGCDAVVTF